VSKDDGAALARQLGCEFMETSAKTAQNVDHTFTRAVRALREMGGRRTCRTELFVEEEEELHYLVRGSGITYPQTELSTLLYHLTLFIKLRMSVCLKPLNSAISAD
jgi:hypothetical protein